MVQTVDFITPILNDAYAFGAVAAANAISDIYAMGAVPVYALNIVCFPVKSLPLGILKEVLRGAADLASEAGVVIAGGHSIEDNTPKYGMTVTGTADPARLVYKKGARPGDKLFLTKPLGIGILTTAIDRELAGKELEEKAYRIMVHLNRGAAEAMLQVGVNACTDVSGYGLLGHLYEMLSASDVSARLYNRSIPVIEEAHELVRLGMVSAGSHSNQRYLLDKIQWHEEVPLEAQIILSDAQTSGGLLIAVPSDRADKLEELLTIQGCLATTCIGEVVEGPRGRIEVCQ